MYRPIISVIIPIYNVEKYIEKCSRSLFEQTLKEDIEFIFVDDASPDKSIQILQAVLSEYPEKREQVKIVRHKNNKGVAVARNTGYNQAAGEYIIHCDSDDYVHPDMYRLMLDKALNEHADVVICDFYASFKTKKLLFKQEIGNDKKTLISKILDGSLHNSLWNKLIHRELYSKIDIKWQEGINMWDDVSIVPRLLYFSEKTVRITEPLYFYNLSNATSHIKQYSESIATQIYLASNTVCDFYQATDLSETYKDDIIRFKHRSLNKILLRTIPNERKKWIERYKDLKNQSISPRMRFADKLTYQLYLKNLFLLGDLITLLRTTYSKLRFKV